MCRGIVIAALSEMQTKSPNSPFFVPGYNCWQTSRINHAAMLIDCANFYRALHESISKAHHSIFILGWEIDSSVRLIRGDEERRSRIPSTIVDLLAWKANQNPKLSIYLLRWDSSVAFITERELMTEHVWTNHTPENLHIFLDNTVPIGGSHHQKIVLIDDEIVFTGGMDIARQRWDERDHKIVESERTDILGPYGPYHDVQILMDGPVVTPMAELVRDRWKSAAGFEALPIRTRSTDNFENLPEIWPTKFPAFFEKMECAISRTIPASSERSGVQEISRMYLDLISQAEKFIYIENQFLTVEQVAVALNQRLKEQPHLKVLLASSFQPKGIFEREGMWAGRIDFKKIVENGVPPSRVKMVCSGIKDGFGKIHYKRIHSKVFSVDNKFLTVASSNISNRSMALDTECDVTLLAANEQQNDWITHVRNDLIAEHSGLSFDQISFYLENSNSLEHLISSPLSQGYKFYEINDHQFTNQNLKPFARMLADPNKPHRILRNPSHLTIAATIVVTIMVVGGLAVAKENSEWFGPQSIQNFLESSRSSHMALPTICLVYVIGGFMFFPVTILSLITAAVFGAIWGPIFGTIGALVSAALMFWVGNLAGSKGLRKFFGDRIRKVDAHFKQSGIVGVAALRLLPVAPFSVVNLAAGISSVRFFDFIVGSFLGFVPGFFAKGLVADSIVQAFINPSPKATWGLIAGIILWLIIVSASYYFARRWQKRRTA